MRLKLERELPSTEAGAGTAGPARRPGRWRRRLLALCMPLVLLVLVEAALRVAGFGAPSAFLLRSQVGERQVWVENARFSRTFFPEGLARSPQPIVLSDPKPEGVIRVFVLGESAAMGDPEPAYGFARMLEVMLGRRHPDRQFEVVNASVTAINSHGVRRIAKDCAKRDGDIWIVYMGNNEVVGPYGAGTVFGDQAPGLGFIRTSVAIKGTRIGQGLEWLVGLLGRGSGQTQWGGMEMFLDEQVARDDPRLEVVYEHFRRNLEDIIGMGRSAGAQMIVGNVAVNLRDSPPFASMHRPDLTGAEREDWDRLVAAGIAADSAGDAAGAAAQFQAALRLDDRHAELHYRLGRVWLRMNRPEEAAASLQRACDLDTLRFRADSRLNALTKEVAQGWGEEGVRFVDLAETCAARSPDGVAGEFLFYEHVHLNPTGNYWVARRLAEEVETILPAQPPDSPADGERETADWPTFAECREALALTIWDERRVLEEMLARVRLPPFTNQADHDRREARWEGRLRDLDRAFSEGKSEADADMVRRALAGRPHDWVLRENAARFLQAQGLLEEAAEQWREVTALAPHYAGGHFGHANAMDALGRHQEALESFRKVLTQWPNSAEARNGMGLALTHLDRHDDAIRAYRRALARRPDFTQARVNMGQLLAQLNRDDEAMEQYLEAVRRDPDHPAARVNLGNLLARQGRAHEAIREYGEALRADPEHAVAHYNLGSALAERDETTAMKHFAAAARIRPEFAEARYRYGLSLVRAGRPAEALLELAEAVRLDPEVAEARLNLGVVLAMGGRYEEAVVQFRECLRLAPGHPTATRYLQQAQAQAAQAR